MQTDQQLIAGAGKRLEAGDFAGAEKLCRDSLSRQGEDAQALMILGLSRFMQGDREEAIARLRRATELDESSDQAWFHLGRVLLAGGDHDAAEQALGQCLSRNPNHPLARVESGRAAQMRGDVESARAAFRTALRADENCVPAMAALASLLLDEGDDQGAYRQAAAAVKLAPDNVAAQLVMSQVFRRQGHIDFAEQCLQNVLEKVPDDPRLHMALAELLQSAGRDREAVTHLNNARRAGYDGDEVDLMMARSLSRSGQPGPARRVLEEVGNRRELTAGELQLLSELRLAGGDHGGVRELLEELERSHRSGGQLIRALLAEAEGRPEEAAGLARDLHEVEDSRIQRQARMLSARIGLANGDTAAAASVLQPLESYAERDSVVACMLANIHDQEGDYPKASRFLPHAGWREASIGGESAMGELHDELLAARSLPWEEETIDDGRPEPVFVLGWPGSGRTALLTALGSHPDIGMMSASESARRYRALEPFGPLANLASLDSARVRLIRRRYFRAAEANGDQLVEPQWFGAAGLPALARFFPGARVIVPAADVRDLEVSWRFTGYRRIGQLLEQWRRDHALLDHLRTFLPLRFIDAQRSELISDPVGVFGRILNELGLSAADEPIAVIDREMNHQYPVGHWRHYAAVLASAEGQ